MTSKARARWVAGAAFALAAGVAWPAIAAFEFADTSWEGCSAFLELARDHLGTERVVATTILDWRELTPNDAILLVHPSSPLDPDEAAAFMKVGGRLGVVDDYGTGDQLLRQFKLERRDLPLRPERFLRGNPALAVATPAYEASALHGPGVHPTVVDVAAVVLNHATGFAHPDLTPVLEVRAAQDDAAPGEPVAVAVAGQVDKGRLFAVGDPSAFINQALRYPGNRAFAKGLLGYLADGDPGVPRRGKLYVLVNDFGEANSFTGETPFRRSIERTLRQMAAGLRTLNSEGFPWWLHALAAAFVGLGVLSWATGALMKGYSPRLPRFAREVPLAAQGGVAGRMAVLAAPGTPLELALLEMRSAAVECLAAELSLPEATPLETLIDAVHERRPLAPDWLARARQVARWMREAESTVARGRRSSLRTSHVLEAAQVVERLLAV